MNQEPSNEQSQLLNKKNSYGISHLISKFNVNNSLSQPNLTAPPNIDNSYNKILSSELVHKNAQVQISFSKKSSNLENIWIKKVPSNKGFGNGFASNSDRVFLQNYYVKEGPDPGSYDTTPVKKYINFNKKGDSMFLYGRPDKFHFIEKNSVELGPGSYDIQNSLPKNCCNHLFKNTKTIPLIPPEKLTFEGIPERSIKNENLLNLKIKKEKKKNNRLENENSILRKAALNSINGLSEPPQQLAPGIMKYNRPEDVFRSSNSRKFIYKFGRYHVKNMQRKRNQINSN